MTCLGQTFTQKWNIGPGQIPHQQKLGEVDEKMGYDIEARTKFEAKFIEAITLDPQQGGQSE